MVSVFHILYIGDLDSCLQLLTVSKMCVKLQPLQDKVADFGKHLGSHYMYLPPLSPPLISCPLFSTFLLFSEEGGRKRQIRLLPQKLPITAWQCVHQFCLGNAEFVNPVQLKRMCELNFSCRFKWVKYCRCMDIGAHAAYLKWETNHVLQLLFTFFFEHQD